MISLTLTCRLDATAAEGCENKMEKFLSCCHYCAGNYDQFDDFARLNESMLEQEAAFEVANRVFYLSIPPSIFVPVAKNSAKAASSKSGYTRVIVEKPFGRDLESSQELSNSLAEVLDEEQIYRSVLPLGYACHSFMIYWYSNDVQEICL